MECSNSVFAGQPLKERQFRGGLSSVDVDSSGQVGRYCSSNVWSLTESGIEMDAIMSAAKT